MRITIIVHTIRQQSHEFVPNLTWQVFYELSKLMPFGKLSFAFPIGGKPMYLVKVHKPNAARM
jgi:hypothetical protein